MNTFEVLSEPARRQILDLIRDDERSVGELVESLSMSQPSVSKHLRVLRSSGFVEARIDGQRRMYHLKPEPLGEVAAWLEPYRKLWEDRLDRLARHLEATKRPGASRNEGPEVKEGAGDV